MACHSLFMSNSDVHNFNIGYKNTFYKYGKSLSITQKEVNYNGIIIFNKLTHNIKPLKDNKSKLKKN